jgi:putative SOS response-associated peptidase YedK
MCARYAFFNGRVVKDDFGVVPLPDLGPRYNIAPMQWAPVILPSDGRWDMALMRWGLVPFWAKDASGAARCINARSESVAERPSFRAAFQSRRCLIPTNGFYEWQGEGRTKIAHFIRRADEGCMMMAGLHEHWGDGLIELDTFTILTTSPNGLMARLHDRMPVILSREGAEAWMNPQSSRGDLEALFEPFDEEQMLAYPVSREVGRVTVDHPRLIEPRDPDGVLF